MIIQTIKIKSNLSEELLLDIARERSAQFREIPGLVQKYYTKLDEPGAYAGVYVWDSPEALQNFRVSDLANSIAQAYQSICPPEVKISNLLFQLRD